MPFHLVSGSRDRCLELFFEPQVEARLGDLLRPEASDPPDEYARRDLGRLIVEAISAAIENRLLPPTDNQVKYAIQVAKELGLQLPPEVLLYRDRMSGFLGRHAETYRRRRRQGEGASVEQI